MDMLALAVDFVLHVDAHLFDLVARHGAWIHAILFCVVFCETGLVIAPFLPGDSLLFAAGAAAGAGLMGFPQTVITLLAAGILGDACNYFIGRHAGPAIFARETRLIRKEHLIQANLFYERHGGKAIVLARFVPVVRTFAPFVAGVALMRPQAFFFYNVAGCVAWVGGLVSAGFFLGSLPWVRSHFSLCVYGIIMLSVLPVLFEWLAARRRGKGRTNR